MAQLAIRPSAAEPAGSPPIDRAHLARMTFSDAALERELLRLFNRQAELLLARIRAGDDGGTGTLSHTLKGSALAVGAMAVAAAAGALESAPAVPARADAIERLTAAVEEARAAIAAMLAGEGAIPAKG